MEKVIHLIALLITFFYITGCSTGDQPTPPPSIIFPETDNTEIDLPAGDSIIVDFVVKKGEEDLNSVLITLDEEIYQGYNDGMIKKISGDTFRDQVKLAAPEFFGEVNQYTFTVTDNIGRTGSDTFTITAN